MVCSSQSIMISRGSFLSANCALPSFQSTDKVPCSRMKLLLTFNNITLHCVHFHKQKWFSNLSGFLTFIYLKQCFCQQMRSERYKIIKDHRNIWQFQKQPDTDYIFLLVLWSHPAPHWWGRGRRSQMLSWELSLSLSCWTCPCSTPSWADLLSGGLSKWRGCRCGCPPCPSTPSVAPDHIHYHLLLLPYPLHNHHHNHHSHFFVPFINAPEFSNTHSVWARITLVSKNHLAGQKSPRLARITWVSKGHLLSGSRSSSCLQFSSCSSSTLLVTFTVVKVEVVVMIERIDAMDMVFVLKMVYNN